MAVDRLKKKIAKGRHASTIKRARQAEKRRARNRQALTRMKTVVKNIRSTPSAEELKKAIPIIARTARKGVVHHRTASRLISRLTKLVAAQA